MLKFLALIPLLASPCMAYTGPIEPLPTSVFSGSWSYADTDYGVTAHLHTHPGRFNEIFLNGPAGLSRLYVWCYDNKLVQTNYYEPDESVLLLEQFSKEWCESPYAVMTEPESLILFAETHDKNPTNS